MKTRCKIMMKTTIIFLADGFEECEALLAVDLLRRAGVDVQMTSVMKGLEVASSRKIRVQADVMAEDVDYASTDMIVLPGGRIGTENLRKNKIVRTQCRAFSAEGKFVAAICAAPSILAKLGLLEGKEATCHPDYEDKMGGAVLTQESVAVAGNIITGQGLGAGFPFAFELVRVLAGEDEVKRIKKAICY